MGNVENRAFYYRLLSILSEKSSTFTITIAIGKKWTFGHPWKIPGGLLMTTVNGDNDPLIDLLGIQ